MGRVLVSCQPLDRSPYAESCRQVNSGVFQAPESTWLVCTNDLTKCALSELFALDETPLRCVHVCVYHKYVIEKRAGPTEA